MGKAPAPVTLEPDDEGQLVLKGELFWKWKAIHEAVQRCDAEIKLRNPLIDAMLEQHPELKKLLGERAAYIQQSMTVRAEYKTVLTQLEAYLGFPMANVSIDDATGRVHRLDQGVPVPLANGVHKTPKPSKNPKSKSTTKKRK